MSRKKKRYVGEGEKKSAFPRFSFRRFILRYSEREREFVWEKERDIVCERE